jgi:hypothetical protein
MEPKVFIVKSEHMLRQVLDRTGTLLYSAAGTLSAGDIYILGLNPGGDGGVSIAEDLKALPRKIDNAYLDESWKNRAGSWKPGQAPLQRRIQWLIARLGYNLQDVCASNLIFIQTRDASNLDFNKNADLCWPVHEEILGIVCPKLVLAFGNSSVSPYAYLLRRFGGDEEIVPSGHGSWKCRGFRARIADRSMYVAGLPHMSRYSPIGRESVVTWLREKIQT